MTINMILSGNIYHYIYIVGCKRPSGWCSHRGSTYESKDCDRDGIADPVCSDTNGNYGVIQSSKKCADSWPRGQCQGKLRIETKFFKF